MTAAAIVIGPILNSYQHAVTVGYYNRPIILQTM